MDIVLEIFDTFVFDRLYAAAFPLAQSPHSWAAVEPLAPHANATWNTLEQSSLQNWHFKPATKYFHVEPTQYAYMSRLPRDDIWRQSLSLFTITWIFGMVMYFGIAGFSYIFVFDKSTMKHPKFLKNQIRLEITHTMKSMPYISLMMVPFFVGDVRGYSKIYDTMPKDSAWYLGGWYSVLQFPLFFLFTDFCIYWIHRWLHIPTIYKRLHKPHHKWILPSPFASHAFHPLDGMAQGLPYHVFPYLFPLNNFAFMAMFTFIQIWTVLIHDGEFIANNPIINGAACHSVHHLEFLGNYGQFTTLFDRMGGTYRAPGSEMFMKTRGNKGGDKVKKVQ